MTAPELTLDVVTIFPEYLAPLSQSLLGRAIARGQVALRVHDLRRWTADVHRTVDDAPYGGGPGMVMLPEPWGRALDDLAPPDAPSQPRLVVPSPAGRPFTQALAGELAAEPFCLSYADGVADIDLGALLAYHRAQGATATMTVVRPELQFGVAELTGDGVVRGFIEKPRSEHWVNGGFFCFEPSVLDVLEPGSVLERAPLERLAARGELRAFRHEGFWDCMDTYKDAVVLNDLWAQGAAPWKLWS